MKFFVGSKNPVKLRAVRELIAEFPCLHGSEGIEAIEVASGVGRQPMTLDEIWMGAHNRAANCFARAGEGDCGIGIESGLIRVPCDTDDSGGWIDITGARVIGPGILSFGLSSGFEVPPEVMRLVLAGNGRVDLSEATRLAGWTEEESIGWKGGIISIISGGRMPRAEQAKQAVRMALYAFERAMAAERR